MPSRSFSPQPENASRDALTRWPVFYEGHHFGWMIAATAGEALERVRQNNGAHVAAHFRVGKPA